MGSIPEAAIAASVIVGLVSIPAASQPINATGDFSEPLPNISGSEETPRNVVQQTSPDGFTARVENAFQEFATHISPGKANASLESPSGKLEMQKKPGKTLWILETSGATLKVSETPERTKEVLEAPEGTLKKVRENGGVRTSFTGTNRNRLEQKMSEMKQRMRQKKQRMEQESESLKRRNAPSVEVRVNKTLAETPEEKAVLVNHEAEEVNLDGWTLSDDSSSYEFDSVKLEPGERLNVLSDEQWSGNDATSIAWNDESDVAKLRNSQGVLVDETTY